MNNSLTCHQGVDDYHNGHRYIRRYIILYDEEVVQQGLLRGCILDFFPPLSLPFLYYSIVVF